MGGIGHLLVATREHRVKVEDVGAEEGRDIGEYFAHCPGCFSEDMGI